MAQTLDSPAPPAPLPAQPVDHGPRPKSKDGNVRTPKWLYAVMTVGLFFVVLPTIRGGAKAEAKPWEGAEGLEWTVPSPAPFHTFETPPLVK